jgi:hypothetical protein
VGISIDRALSWGQDETFGVTGDEWNEAVGVEKGDLMTETIGSISMEEAKCCLGCGYCLKGLAEQRCPECGKGFDPQNAATFIPTESCPRGVIWLITPARWPADLSVGFTILLLIISAAYFVPLYIPLALWLIVYLIITIPFLLRSWIRQIAIDRFRLNPELRKVDNYTARKARKWLAAALILTALKIPSLVLICCELPWLSHEAHWLYDEEGMMANYPHRLWFGPIPVRVNDVIPWGVYFKVQGRGIVYCPIHPPPGGVTQYFWHLFGNWYVQNDY